MYDPKTGACERTVQIPPLLDCRGHAPYLVNEIPLFTRVIVDWITVMDRAARFKAGAQTGPET